MAEYAKILPFVLIYEDGIKIDKQPQKGKSKYLIPMNYDINSADYDFLKDGKKEKGEQNIRLVDLDEAIKIYKSLFWDVMKLDDLNSDKKAFLCFDAAVNHGIYNATGLIQKVLKEIGYNTPIDKLFGEETFTLLNLCNETDFIYKFFEKRETLYRAIIKKNPSQKKNLPEWMDRMRMMKRDIDDF